MHAIVILNDGTTWTGIDGSSICIITDEDLQHLHDGLCPSELHRPLFEFRLTDCTPPQEIETIYRVKDGGISD